MSAEADFAVACDYKAGSNGRSKSTTDYLRLMQSAADEGHPIAQYDQWMILIGGVLTKNNKPEAERYISAAQNYLPAIGICYEYGYDVAADSSIARAFFQVAADRGDMRGLYRLAEWYCRNNHGNLARRLIEAAESTTDYAIHYLRGWYAEFGIGGPVDMSAAVDRYGRAAEFGSTAAAVRIGRIYLTADYADYDTAIAFRWMQTAADQNNFSAQREVALAWFSGRADPPSIVDVDEGLRWLRLAATDDVDAQYELGSMYLTGKTDSDVPVQSDLRKAVELLEMAAQAGHSAATVAIQRLRRSS